MSWDVPIMREAFLRVQQEIENQLFKKNKHTTSRFFECGKVDIAFKKPVYVNYPIF